jgi:signal transduction histidine kinase
VTDDGPGIAPQDLPYVFERFYRGDRSRSRRGGSTGLGLSISRKLVEAHGGRMWAESTPDQGARFVFRLPVLKEFS